MTPILYDSHMHTPLCKHATGQPEAYAAHAEKRGLTGIVITCHNPIPDGHSRHVRMSMTEFDQYVNMVERTRQAWAGRVDVRLGLESDYYPGAETWLTKLHTKAEFHHILGSVHPQMQEYKNSYYRGSILEFNRTYYEHLAMVAETGLFDTIAHPDIVKIVYPHQWSLPPLMDDIRRCLDRIAKTGVAMELNTSGLQKVIREMNPAPAILTEIRERRIPIMVNSDAHEPTRVAADFEPAFDLLLSLGFTEISYFLYRQRQTVAITTAKLALRSL